IMAELMGQFRMIQEGIVFPFTMPAIPGLGTGGGFEMQVQDRGGLGLEALETASKDLAYSAADQPDIQSAISTFTASVPKLFAEVDRVKTLTLGVPLQTVFEALQAYLGSAYVNDFNKFGRTWQVNVQADSIFRTKAEDISRLQVRNKDGNMVPLGTLLNIEKTVGPTRVDRYNLYPSSLIMGEPAPGISSGQAMNIMEQMADKRLPTGIGYQWTTMAFQQKKAGAQGVIVFGMAILVVFLILAAQYESWADPFAVILIVPLAVSGAVVALMARGMDNNIYTQVGLVLLVGLSAKNAILIVEFARDMRSKGKGAIEAAVEGAKLRFRPILMTSFAFIFGVLPLVVASGAGAVSRQSLGTAVAAGMLGVTILGVFFTPVLYVLIQRRAKRESEPSPQMSD
ncbi:MAG: efflux RND transporter permease subunit, partial [Desulfomonile tiedjei]|nr:efflux RND transporter permease subunit [Desulfomonile tiedjei]